MGIRLDRIISGARADSRLSVSEVDAMIAEANANKKHKLSKANRSALVRLLAAGDCRFDGDAEGGAEGKLKTFLGMGSPPPPPSIDADAAMAQSLDQATGEGLTGQTFERAMQEISATYGAAIAERALLKSLGVRVGSLAVDGVAWLQRHHGSMHNQIERLQTVLQTHIEGALLLDANFNGKLDADDQVLTRDAGDLKMKASALGEQLRDKVRIGAAMVEACEAMARAKHQFALAHDQQFDSRLWDYLGGGGFIVKDGVRPSAALNGIFENPGQYKFECLTAQIIARYKAMLDLLGPKDFDLACPGLRVGPFRFEETLAEYFRFTGTGIEATPARKTGLRAGDYTYFKNWDVSPDGYAAGWQGENVVALGGGKFYGHPFGIATEPEIVGFLNQHRRPGSTRSASMIEVQGRFDPKILTLDLDPVE